MFAGTWQAIEGDAAYPALDIEGVGAAWHLTWRDGSGAARSGCGLASGAWLYAARTPADAEGARASGTAAEFDSRSGVIVYQVSDTGTWPTTFYHPGDAGKPTTAMSDGAPRHGLEGSFLVGYESKTGERHDAITAIIARDGERYLFTWEKGGVVLYRGIGLARGPRFGAAWGLPGFDHEVVVATLDGDSLVCTSSALGRPGITTARLRRAAL